MRVLLGTWILLHLALCYALEPTLAPEYLLTSLICALPVFVVLRAFAWMIRLVRPKKRERPEGDPLDRVILSWDRLNHFTRRHLLQSFLCIGQSGSGKSSGPLRVISGAILADPRTGGVINESKPEEAEFWDRLFAEAGRKDDQIVFGPGHPARFNFLEFLVTQRADSREVAKALMTLQQTIDNSAGSGGGDDYRFWESMKSLHFETAIEVIRQARGTVTAVDLERFISSAAHSPEELGSEQWVKTSFLSDCFRQAFAKERTDVQKYDYDHSYNTWIKAYPRLADKLRSSVVTDMQGVLHVLNTGIVRDLLGTTTNVTPEVTGRSKWISVRMPITTWGASGALVNGAIKLANQRYVLRRHAKPGDCINVNIIDEYQQHITSFDADYLAQCRSHYGCMLVLTQSAHAIFSAMKGGTGEHQAKALTTNYGSKLVLTVGDSDSAIWASSLLGNRLRTFVGGSQSEKMTVGDEMFGRSGYSGSYSESFSETLQPAAFLGGLRCGGRRAGYMVDGWLIRNSEPFLPDGEHHLLVSFSQR